MLAFEVSQELKSQAFLFKLIIMSEFKGTKSPWKIDNNVGIFNQGGLYQVPISGNDRKNRQVSNVFGVNEIEGKANAKLISLAPELLQMVIEMKEGIEYYMAHSKPDNDGDWTGFLNIGNNLIVNSQILINKATEL